MKKATEGKRHHDLQMGFEICPVFELPAFDLLPSIFYSLNGINHITT